MGKPTPSNARKNKKKETTQNTGRQIDRWAGRNHKQSTGHNGNTFQPHVGGPNDVLIICEACWSLLTPGLVSHCTCVCVCIVSSLHKKKWCQRMRDRERKTHTQRRCNLACPFSVTLSIPTEHCRWRRGRGMGWRVCVWWWSGGITTSTVLCSPHPSPTSPPPHKPSYS